MSGKETKSNVTTKLASDSSSLVDLKAEVFRKQEEARFNKFHGRNVTSEKSDVDKKNNIWSKKNIGILKRSAKDDEIEAKERLRVQNVLHEKAKLYDDLQRGDRSDTSGRFLVNFGRKSDRDDDRLRPEDIPDAETPDDEFVEYVDALGRSRMCMRSELATMKRRDVETFGQHGDSTTTSPDDKLDTDLQLLSEDMRRELLRQKWEQEEEENLKKTQLHYKDVLFDEARTHGAAFYNFSRNESDRLSEMANLDALHKETVKARSHRDSAKAKRDKALKARLKKVRDRKRLKQGLPILEDNSDSEGPDDVAEGLETEKSMEQSVMDSLRDIRKAEDDRKRKDIVREWDIGKEGVAAEKATDQAALMLKRPMEKAVMSQDEWVVKKRTERPAQFAPPSMYEGKLKAGGQSGKAKNQHFNKVNQGQMGKQGQKHATGNTRPPYETRPQYQGQKRPNYEGQAIPKVNEDKVSLQDRLRLHIEINEPISYDEEDRTFVKCEIPPPTNMDYYSCVDKSKAGNVGGRRMHNDMAEAFLYGLKNKLRVPNPDDSDDD